ncbi:hypothetical protein P879_02384 [Paragonimus westermani]|uniref:Uncharacterized protein n=1 Tax=Paragonimus westermani TaxID=34504 RepID=A0A8T0DNA3_9TREM|nr:hypothetical protein P879_02384 [Paragonimus westermani]
MHVIFLALITFGVSVNGYRQSSNAQEPDRISQLRTDETEITLFPVSSLTIPLFRYEVTLGDDCWKILDKLDAVNDGIGACEKLMRHAYIPEYNTISCYMRTSCLFMMTVSPNVKAFDKDIQRLSYDEQGDTIFSSAMIATQSERVEQPIETKTFFLWRVEHSAEYLVSLRERLQVHLQNALRQSHLDKEVVDSTVFVNKPLDLPCVFILIRVMLVPLTPQQKSMLKTGRKPTTFLLQKFAQSYIHLTVCPGFTIRYSSLNGYLCQLKENTELVTEMLRGRQTRQEINKQLIEQISGMVRTRKDNLANATFLIRHHLNKTDFPLSVDVRFNPKPKKKERSKMLKYLLRLLDLEQNLHKFIQQTVYDVAHHQTYPASEEYN